VQALYQSDLSAVGIFVHVGSKESVCILLHYNIYSYVESCPDPFPLAFFGGLASSETSY
jgi:hypothetical protein